MNNNDQDISYIVDIENTGLGDQEKQIKRKVAINVQTKIFEYLYTDEVSVAFSAHWECHKENID